MSKLSIIIPVYYNGDTLMDCYCELKENALSDIGRNGDDYELIFVDDGSKDDSYNVMLEISKLNTKAKALKLSRNFGTYAAFYAGLSKCDGDCVAIKTADSQEPSQLIIDMFDSWKRGNKVVLATRTDRDEGFSRKLFSRLYTWLVRSLSNKAMPKGSFDCFLIDHQVVEILRALNEKNSAFLLQLLWIGFSPAHVPYRRLSRKKGKSKWTFAKKVNLVLDSLIGFSTIPVRALSVVGIAVFCISIIWALYLVVIRLMGGIDIQGWTVLMCTVLFSTGLIMLSLAVLSEYIWRILDASRGRPIYIIDEQFIADGELSDADREQSNNDKDIGK